MPGLKQANALLAGRLTSVRKVLNVASHIWISCGGFLDVQGGSVASWLRGDSFRRLRGPGLISQTAGFVGLSWLVGPGPRSRVAMQMVFTSMVESLKPMRVSKRAKSQLDLFCCWCSGQRDIRSGIHPLWLPDSVWLNTSLARSLKRALGLAKRREQPLRGASPLLQLCFSGHWADAGGALVISASSPLGFGVKLIQGQARSNPYSRALRLASRTDPVTFSITGCREPGPQYQYNNLKYSVPRALV
jgi:hypothetical protein